MPGCNSEVHASLAAGCPGQNVPEVFLLTDPLWQLHSEHVLSLDGLLHVLLVQLVEAKLREIGRTSHIRGSCGDAWLIF